MDLKGQLIFLKPEGNVLEELPFRNKSRDEYPTSEEIGNILRAIVADNQNIMRMFS